MQPQTWSLLTNISVKVGVYHGDLSARSRHLHHFCLKINSIKDAAHGAHDADVYKRAQSHVDGLLALHRKRPDLLTSFIRLNPLVNKSCPIALLATLSLRMFACLPNMSQLWTLDDSIWTYVFLWIEYFLPINHPYEEKAIATLLDKDYNVLSSILALISTAFSLFRSPRPPIRNIMLEREYFAPRTFIKIWLNGPLLMNGAEIDRGMMMFYGLDFMHEYIVRHDDSAVRALLIEEILKITKSRPGRVFGKSWLAWHHRCLDLFHPLSDERHWDKQLELGSALADVPALGASDCPREMIRCLISNIKWAISDERLKTAVGNYKLMHKLFVLSKDDRLIRTAIRYDLLSLPSNLRAASQEHAVDTNAVLDIMGGSLVSPRALREFHRSYSRIQGLVPRPQLGRKEMDLVALCAKRLSLVNRRKWALQQKCCRNRCSNRLSTYNTAKLRACLCGEALYCSSGCQRAHWVEGKHRQVCPYKANPADILPAKQYAFLVSIAHASLVQGFSDIQSKLLRHEDSFRAAIPLDLDLTRGEPRGPPMHTVYQLLPRLDGGTILGAVLAALVSMLHDGFGIKSVWYP
ncbi:uncharacterized protein SCHCODRAFT_02519333 [Schizophyllum commune H4-8]|nr:uncharacterized protein SCHCODRAFT_02519333 [Schizophyllum commune H4-8]KAI5886215.1 hypothetical protein SCHCODRAFT_02519333 [Schizophyllum commune H4-8]